MNHLLVIGLGMTYDLFWPIRREGRTAGEEVTGTGKSFCFVFMKAISEETILLLLLDIILFYVLFGAFLLPPA